MAGTPDDAKIIYTGPSPRGWHRLQQAAECLQKYAWTYEKPKVEGGSEQKSPALVKGTLIHLALAQHYVRMRARQRGENQDDWAEPYEAVELIAKLEGAETYVENILETYEAYAACYEDDEHTWEIMGVEELNQTMIKGKYLLTGRLDLSVRDKGGRIWGVDHKCEPASTRVLTDCGPTTVGELAQKGQSWTCCAWDEAESRTVWTEANKPVPAGIQDVYQLELSDGTQDRHGYNHPILTETGWKKVEDLTVGTWVAIAAPPDVPEAPIDDDVLTLAGFAISDGGRIKKESMGYVITAHDSAVRRMITDALDRLGDSWAEHKRGNAVQGIRLHTGGKVREFLHRVGVDQKLSKDKVLPAELRSLSQRQAGILLGSLWEGDGSAYLGTPSASGAKPLRIIFSSRSSALASSVRHLLLQLGILSNIRKTKITKSYYYQVIVIGQQNKRRFLHLAQTGVIRCPPSVRGGRKTRSGRILEPFAALSDELESHKKKTKAVVPPSHDYPGRGRKQNPRFEKGIRWVQIKKKEYVGKEMCYDIEVPRYHTFLTGDCLITHNSTSRITANHAKFYGISGQLLGYSHMTKEKFGDNYGGFIVNLIQHGPKHRFQRIPLSRSPNLEARFEQIVVDIEESIERMQASGRHYTDWPKAVNEMTCYGRYGPCPFLEQCKRGEGSKVGGDWSFSL